MKKILYIAPHLSTGGLPQYLYRKIVETSNQLEVHCIEYENITGGKFIIQRKRIEDFLGNRFYSIGGDREEIFRVIDRIKPDFIHLEEIPEYFLPSEISDRLYSTSRKYKIFETSHDSSFNPERDKQYLPDAFFFVSQWQMNQYQNINVPKYLAEYPIDWRKRQERESGLRKLGLDPSKKHVLNVGLFTPRKNQAELFEVAKRFDDSVQFHFLGNQADNFLPYWEPLLRNKPSNCVVWGERSDTDDFYSCMDAFYFASRGNNGDKETMPLVLKEALGWKIPILLYNLDVYMGYFDKFENIKYLEDSAKANSDTLASLLGIENMKSGNVMNMDFETWYEIEQHLFHVKCLDNTELAGRKMTVVLADSRNNLTSYNFDMDYTPGFAMWFKSNGWPSHFNGFRVDVYDKENNRLLHSKVVHDFGRQEQICPKVKGKCVDIKHTATDHSSWFTFYEVFLRGDYDNIKKGDVVVDIGANLGYVSLYAVEKGASKVYSIEPDPTNFEFLKENTKDFDEITPVQYAISDRRGELDFYQGEASSIATTYSISENIASFKYSKSGIKVKSIDPNSLIEELGIERIDYLKIDCEGAEFEFFRTIDEKFLSEKVGYIVGEAHAFAGSQHEYETQIKAKLIRCGFEVSESSSLDMDLNLLFKATKRPRIKIVHLLNTPEETRERESIESLRKLEEYGINYHQVITPLYKDVPPKENCNRPDAVSGIPGDYLLGPGHYGCYLAHRKGITEGFEEGVDAILLNECDSMLQFGAKEMSEKIFEAYDLAIKHDLAYVSFGKKIPGHPHENPESELYTTDRLSEAHCILITKDKSQYFKDKFEKTPWDVSDLWYNVFITEFRKGIFSRPYSLQHPGVSNIDMLFKDGYQLHESNSLMSNFENSDISVVIQTCDAYEFLWRGWYLSFKNNWDWSLGWPVHFCTETKSAPFNDRRITTVNTEKSQNPSGFSNRLIELLSGLKTKYVLYIQEDMWLKSKVNGEELRNCLYLLKHFEWNSVKVHEKIWYNYDLRKTNHFVGDKRLLKYNKESEYLLTHNAAIWDREFLLDSMIPDEDPWRNELDGTKRIGSKLQDPEIYHHNMGWYHQLGIQTGGKFTAFGEELNRQLIATEESRVKLDI
jgi:FkbM family methyltransferase